MPDLSERRVARPGSGAAETVDAPDGPPESRGVREPEQIGGYRVLERINEGGMGIVYKAEQRTPVRRVVALKVVKVGMDTKEVVARFEAERQALALMNHPNVAKVFDAGVTESGRPYFAMEYVPGVPLTEYCDENRLTVRERLELFVQVCQAVQHAHQKGIIHRDLKPSNILVAQFEGRAVPKVIDFGIAKAMNQALTQQTLFTHAGTMVGTPEYASPEQVYTSGLDVDTRTDIYSLGVILYQLLTGTLPLDPRTLRKVGPEEMVRIIREEEPPRPSTRLSAIRKDPDPAAGSNGDPSGAAGAGGEAALTDLARRQRTDPRSLWRQVRGDLDWITLKAMDKDRTRRYETANALANDVRRYLHDEPVAARPPTAFYQVKKFVRRHRFGAGATAAVVFALVGGIIGTTAGLIRAWRAEADSQAAKERAEGLQRRLVNGIQAAGVQNEFADRMLKAGQYEGAAALSQLTLEYLQREAGADDWRTWDAVDARARAAFGLGQPSLAWDLLRPVTDYVRGRNDLKVPHDLGRYFTDQADVGEKLGVGRGVIELLLRDAIRFYPSDALSRGRTARRLGRMFEEGRNLPEAEVMYARAAHDLAAALDASPQERVEARDGYRDFLIRTRRFEAALPVLEAELKLLQQEHEAFPRALAKQADLVDAEWQAGSEARRGEARDDFAKLVKAGRLRRGGLDGLAQYYWRQLVLRSGLDDFADRWKSPAIRAGLWLAVTDALTSRPSGGFELDEIPWARFQFELSRWDGNEAVAVRKGSLEALREVPDQSPGVYLLTAQVPVKEGEPLRVATWLLFAKWDLRLFNTTTDARSEQPPPTRPSNETGPGARPAHPDDVRALVLGQLSGSDSPYADLRVDAGLPVRPEYFRVLATADLVLPPGKYRLMGTSDDGVVVNVNRQPAIDAWRNRPVATDSAPVDLSGGTAHLVVEYFQGKGDFLLNVSAEPMDERVTKLMRDALGDRSPALRRWLIERAAAWEQQPSPDFALAAAYYRQAAEVGCRLPAIDRPDQSRVTRALAGALARGPAPATAPAIEAARAVVTAAQAAPSSNEAEPNALLDLAAAELAAGRSRDEVAPTLSKAFKLWRAKHTEATDRRGRDFVRHAQLLAMGAATQPSDGSVTGQVLCAADEMLRNEPASHDVDPKSLSPSSVHYRLVRWDAKPGEIAGAAADASTDERTLADAAPTPPQPAPGLYLLAVRINGAGRDGAALTQAYWILLCPWKLAMYTADHESVFNRNTFAAMTAPGRPSADEASANGLALLDPFKPEPLTAAPASGCGIRATANAPRLPPGRYRIEITASDGARLLVGQSVGQPVRVINAWPLAQPARVDSAEVDLEEGRALEVHFFRGNDAAKLWLRAEPLSAEAQAFAQPFGLRRPARTLDVAMREQDDALAVDPQSLAAFAARAGIHVQMGRLSDAASDYTAAADIDFGEPLWPQQRALVALLAGDAVEYQRQREEMFARSKGQGPWRRDRSLAARFLLTARLGGPDDPANARAAEGRQPISDLANGVGAYRAGKWDDAIKTLSACRDRLSPAARLTADLFRAMALHRGDNPSMAEELLDESAAAVAQLDPAHQPEWDTYAVQDWLTCRIALAQAKELIRPGTAAAVPAAAIQPRGGKIGPPRIEPSASKSR